MIYSTRALQADFSAAAPHYDAAAVLQQRVMRALAEMLQPHLAPDAQVLDAGCGTGALALQHMPWRITGVDVARGMCDVARARMPAACADIAALPFATGAFDAVFCSLALQWVNHASAALMEFARVVKPGGMLALATFAPGTLGELQAALAAASRISTFSEISPPPQWQPVQRVDGAYVEMYDSAAALMRQLKAIGAENKRGDRPRGLAGKLWLLRAERRYALSGGPFGVPATWRVVFHVWRRA